MQKSNDADKIYFFDNIFDMEWSKKEHITIHDTVSFYTYSLMFYQQNI